MTIAEDMAISMLKDFVATASEHGICYNGEDIPRPLQVSVIKIIEQYIEEYEE